MKQTLRCLLHKLMRNSITHLFLSLKDISDSDRTNGGCFSDLMRTFSKGMGSSPTSWLILIGSFATPFSGRGN